MATLHVHLPFELVILLLGTYPTDMPGHVIPFTNIQIFIAIVYKFEPISKTSCAL